MTSPATSRCRDPRRARRRAARRRPLRPRRGRVRRLLLDNPILATYLGIHTEDDRLGDGSRDAVLEEIAAERTHLAAVEALDPAGLSQDARFERDLEIHNLRSRSSTPTRSASGSAGRPRPTRSATRCSCCSPATLRPLAERLEPIAAPARGDCPPSSRSRSPGRPARRSPLAAARAQTPREMPGLFGEIRAAAEASSTRRSAKRLDTAVARRREALEAYGAWLQTTLADADDDWPLGRERYDELVALPRVRRPRRRRDPRDRPGAAAGNSAGSRRAAAREIDPDADEPTVIDRVKSDHPATFEEALDGYRDVMGRARAYLIEHDIVTVPDDERIEVIADARVPAQRHAVRRVLRARRGSTPTGAASTSSRRRSTTTRTRCASTTAARSATRASTRRTRATTSSSRSRRAHPSPDPAADRRPRVRRGLGHVLASR